MSHQPQAGHQPQNDNILIMHLNAMLTLDQPLLYISKDWNSFFEDLSYSDYLGPFHLYNSFVASPAVKFTFPGEAPPPIFLILSSQLDPTTMTREAFCVELLPLCSSYLEV